MSDQLCYVTGATGFVGSHLAELLLEQGKRVRLLVRSKSRLMPSLLEKCELVEGTLNDDPEKLAKGMEGVDYVYHVAGLIGATKQAAFDKVNVDGTKNLLEAVKASDATLSRFLLVSSLAGYGPSDTLGRPREEADDGNPQPGTMYGRSKLAGEQLAWKLSKEYEIPMTSIRPPAVYGPRDRGIFEFFKFMAAGLEVGMRGEPKYLDLIHGRDLVRGMVMAAESDAASGEAYYLTDAGNHEMRALMAVMRKVMKPKKTRVFISPVFVVRIVAKVNDILQAITGKMRLPNTDKLGELLPARWTCSGDKAKKDFGFECEISLEEGFAETSNWYEDEGWIKVRR